MQSFIVLGIIPGTNIQTNLNFWLIVATALLVFVLRAQLVAARNFIQLLITAQKIAHIINHFELTAI